jgi:hypothetical protein
MGMKRSGTAMVAFFYFLPRKRNLLQIVAATVANALVLFVLCMTGMAQSGPSGTGVVNLLGPHNEGARGCTLCHASRTAASQPAGTSSFLWGVSDVSYGNTIALADASHYVEVDPSSLAGTSSDVTGVLVCLSCHDGNLTPYNMLQSWSYEHQVGLLGRTKFSTQKIPSLLGREEAPIEDHPIGPYAPINPGGGLVFSNGTFSVTPNSPYARFIENYGWPSLAPRKHTEVGVSSSGEPYTLCTTCHDQHVHNVYVSGPKSPIGGDASGKFYTTYFFLKGPYNPAPERMGGYSTRSSEQFCRQCHFDLANEGNNVLTARTLF